jgi:DNA polymerase-4
MLFAMDAPPSLLRCPFPVAPARAIIHVDLDAFYASVEERDRPELRARPLIVGGPPASRAVVCAASYAARARGVRSAMPCAVAARLCPEAVFVAPDFPRYEAASAQVRAILLSCTALVEPLALDEAYLDVSADHLGSGAAARLAAAIRQRIAAATGLTASAGVGPNKFIAKAASDRAKPNGLVAVDAAQAAAFAGALPVEALPGVGEVTAARLHARGFRQVAALTALAEPELVRLFGMRAATMRELCQGIDDRPVVAARARRSLGIERTFARDINERSALLAELAALSDGLGARLEEHGCRAHTLTVTVKYHDFRAVTRSRTLREAFAGAPAILALAGAVLGGQLGEQRAGAAVRLLGLSAAQLVDAGAGRQERLF